MSIVDVCHNVLYAIYIKIDAVYITFQRSFSYDKMWYFMADCMEKSFYLCFHFITFSTMNEKQDIKCATIILYEKHAALLHINAKSYFILTCKSGCKKSFCNIAWRDNACRLTNLIEMSLAKRVCSNIFLRNDILMSLFEHFRIIFIIVLLRISLKIDLLLDIYMIHGP